MAVSQYLRQGSLLDAVRSLLTRDVVRTASSQVGEPESSTQQALNAAAPSVLSGLGHIASSREGAANLMDLIQDGGFGSFARNAGALLADSEASTSVLSMGQELVGKIFGNKSSAVIDTIARSSGVSSASAGKLTALVTPLVLGVLGRRVTENKLDATGLANTLLAEKSEITAATPPGISQLLSTGPTVVSSRAAARETAESPQPSYLRRGVATPPTGSRWPMLGFGILAALALLGLLLLLRGRMPNTNLGDAASRGVNAAQNALQSIRLPGGTYISVAPGSINQQLVSYLADKSSSAPRTFVFDNLNFESSSAQLTPASEQTVNNLAAVLKAYPAVQIELAGYTDNTGTPEANQTLSQDRANAVKGRLADQGIAPSRLTTRGYGEEHPVASNDSEEGKARNRRLELTVTSK